MRARRLRDRRRRVINMDKCERDDEEFFVPPESYVRSMRKLQTMMTKNKMDISKHCFVIAKVHAAPVVAYLLYTGQMRIGNKMLAEALPCDCGDLVGFVDEIPVVLRFDCPPATVYLINSDDLRDWDAARAEEHEENGG